MYIILQRGVIGTLFDASWSLVAQANSENELKMSIFQNFATIMYLGLLAPTFVACSRQGYCLSLILEVQYNTITALLCIQSAATATI